MTIAVDLGRKATKQTNNDHTSSCYCLSLADPDGGTRSKTHALLENHKAIGLLINTGPDPMENHKATKSAFNVGPSSVSQRNAMSDGPMMVRFERYKDHLSPSSTEKTTVRVGPPLPNFLDPRMPLHLSGPFEDILLDFSLTVKAATLIVISGRGSAISSAK